ncbi:MULTISPECIES: 5-oxoprolinase subunit B family protein [unclassified Agromyces]|uniref:5-oxoprolinase subunit B family protein n=1 Tax=unclassified Agromyces TaxID=2639701 RepID=UPI0030154D6C
MSRPVRLLPSGPAALLVEVDGLGDVIALHDALAADAPTGLVELVPAARTLLVAVDPAVLPLETAAGWVRRVASEPVARSSGSADGRTPAPREVLVEVDYRGDDLADTADVLGVSPEHLVARHADAAWRVAFIGFAPGFAYLVADDWPFDVPRLDVARTRVPRGAIGLAAGFSGAYPRESPGGWRLVGRTGAALWDPDADPPALLAPGRTVRFRAVTP